MGKYDPTLTHSYIGDGTTVTWVEVQIFSSPEAYEVVGWLRESGLQGSWDDGTVVHLYWSADQWNETIRDEILRVINPRGTLEEKLLTVRGIADEDWNAKWAESVEPIWIGQRVLVRPSWEQVRVKEDTIELVVDPMQAFGTGHHGTTQLLIEWLEEVIRGGERVLDIGTGSGILAMVALRLGAKSALGIDYDQVALDCARSYAQVNGFGEELQLRAISKDELSVLAEKEFDLVLANLDRRTLLENRGVFQPLLLPGGCACVSGILTEDEQEMVEAFRQVGGVMLRRWGKGEWVALEVGFPEPCEGG